MKKFFVIGAFALSILTAFTAFALTDFAGRSPQTSKFVREIITPDGTYPTEDETSGLYVRLKLDNDVASGSNKYRDLLIVENDAREIPYQLVIEDAYSTKSYYESRILDRGVDTLGRLSFVIDLGRSGLLHNRLSVISDNLNYRRQVSVYATNTYSGLNETNWMYLTGNGYIFKFTDPVTRFSTAQGSVDYPDSSARYIKVVIDAGTEGPISISSASVYTYEVSAAKEEEFIEKATISDNKDRKATEITIDLGSSGIPTRRITLALDASNPNNFSRQSILEGSEDGQTWRHVTGGYLSQISTKLFVGRNLSIEYPESMYRYYRVSVLNRDDEPLSFDSIVTFTQVMRSVVFNSIPGKTYMLYYGNPNAYPPQYDLARFFSYLDTTQLPEAKLEAERENPRYVAPPPPTVPFTDRNKTLLNVTLVVLTLVIAGLVFLYVWKYVRKTRPALPENDHIKNPPIEPPPQS